MYPVVVSTLDNDNTFCFAMNKGPLIELPPKSKNIFVNLDTSSIACPGKRVPPLSKKSGPPVLDISSRSFGGFLVT